MSVSENFDFPFKPYEIQKNFMGDLYETLENGKVGIFESPTGTGKSLSIICGSLSWLLDHEKREKSQLETDFARIEKELKDLEISDDWIAAFGNKQTKEEEKDNIKKQLEKIIKTEEKVSNLKKPNSEKVISRSKRKAESSSEVDCDSGDLSDDIDADIAPTDYSSDTEESKIEEKEEEEYKVMKIFYCSRTHSQLGQFLQEILKTRFSRSIRVITLGSRQTLCVNPNVKRLGNVSLINDRCIEMQKGSSGVKIAKTDENKTKRNSKRSNAHCPFYQCEAMEGLAEELLSKVHQVDKITSIGQQRKACPYYGSRFALPLAQLVLLPYQVLLHDATRSAWGINLDNNVVIVDEAHNLLEAVASMYSVEVSYNQLCTAQAQLRMYADKFKDRLKAKNLMYVRQLVKTISLLIKCLQPSTTNNDKNVFGISEFLLKADFDDINFFKLISYIDKSHICKKLYGFACRYQGTSIQTKTTISGVQKLFSKQSDNKDIPNSNVPELAVVTGSPLFQVRSFLDALTSKAEDGRIVIKSDKAKGNSKLRFLLLNPASRLESVISKCRSVLLAGGTMEPSDELTDALHRVCQMPNERLHRFTCGHVIQSNHLLPLIVTNGPNGKQLNFNFEWRQKPETIQNLGSILVNLVRIVPGGIVVFLPSYDYADFVYERFKETGVVKALNDRKRVFREPRVSSEVDAMLTEYGRTIRNSKGALLFAVVGGKMSEGINFGDELARCVVLVGLPYPNRNSPELQEKLKYLNATVGSGAGDRHYNSLCLKAVNQSIGRAIRHKDDYASIILLDHRFAQPMIRTKLPSWIRGEIKVNDKFGQLIVSVKEFFQLMNK